MPLSVYEFCQQQEILREVGAGLYAKFRKLEDALFGQPLYSEVRQHGTDILRLNQRVLLARDTSELSEIESEFSNAREYLSAVQC